MAGTVQSLFGDMFKTPEQIRREQQEALMNEGRQSAGMLMAGGGSGLAQAIKGHAANIAQYIPTSADQLKRGALQAAGQVAAMQGNEEGKRALNLAAMSPEERDAAITQQIASQTDTTNIYSIKQAIEKFKAAGNARGVEVMTQKLKEAQQRNLDRERQARMDKLAVNQDSRAAAAERRALEQHQTWVKENQRKEGVRTALDSAGVKFDMKNPLAYYENAYKALTDAGYGSEAEKYAMEGAKLYREQQEKADSKIYKVVPDYGSASQKAQYNSMTVTEQKLRNAGKTEQADKLMEQLKTLDTQMLEWQKNYDISTATNKAEAEASVERKAKHLETLDEKIVTLEDEAQYLDDFYSKVMLPMQDSSLYTGALAEEQTRLTLVLQKFGMSNEEAAKTAANTQVAEAFLTEQVLDYIKQLGANPTDSDREYIKNMLPQITKSPDALKEMYRYMQLRHKEEVQNVKGERSWVAAGKDPADYKVERIEELEQIRKEAQNNGLDRGYIPYEGSFSSSGKPNEMFGKLIFADPTESFTPSSLAKELGLAEMPVEDARAKIDMQRDALMGIINDPQRPQEDKANAVAKLKALFAIVNSKRF